MVYTFNKSILKVVCPFKLYFALFVAESGHLGVRRSDGTALTPRALDKGEANRQRANGNSPINPPIRKQASWMTRTTETMQASFFPLRFSRMLPAILMILAAA